MSSVSTATLRLGVLRRVPSWVVALTVVTAPFVLLSRATGTSAPATSPWALASTTVAAVVVALTLQSLEVGWTSWRRTVTALVAASVAFPLLWSVAVLVSRIAPGGTLAWLTALVAHTGHLPLLASFSTLPLLAVRYLGRGTGRTALVVVALAGALAFVSFALFFDGYAPLAASAPVRWVAGDAVGGTLHAVFLATVLLGPVVALHAAWRADGEAARRLALVAGSALAGAALVMLCGAVVGLGAAGGTLVLTAMPIAVAVVAVGCTRALTTRLLTAHGPSSATEEVPAPPTPPRGGPGSRLTPREAEVVDLLAQGLSNAGIAARLVVSERTVDAHLRSAFVKLELPEGAEQNRRVHAVLAWRESPPGAAARS